MFDKSEKNGVYDFVLENMEAGIFDKEKIANYLATSMSMEESEALSLVEREYQNVIETIEKEKYTQKALMPALAGALAGALVGGGIWGLIAIFANYEIGFAAIGVGWLAGFVAILASRGVKGLPIQLAAVGMSIFGIIFGKYLTFAHFFREGIKSVYNGNIPDEFSMFSTKIITLFIENIHKMVAVYDLLWIALAVMAAWNITKAVDVELPEDIN